MKNLTELEYRALQRSLNSGGFALDEKGCIKDVRQLGCIYVLDYYSNNYSFLLCGWDLKLNSNQRRNLYTYFLKLKRKHFDRSKDKAMRKYLESTGGCVI